MLVFALVIKLLSTVDEDSLVAGYHYFLLI